MLSVLEHFNKTELNGTKIRPIFLGEEFLGGGGECIQSFLRSPQMLPLPHHLHFKHFSFLPQISCLSCYGNTGPAINNGFYPRSTAVPTQRTLHVSATLECGGWNWRMGQIESGQNHHLSSQTALFTVALQNLCALISADSRLVSWFE